jgi:hypothetical protein
MADTINYNQKDDSPNGPAAHSVEFINGVLIRDAREVAEALEVLNVIDAAALEVGDDYLKVRELKATIVGRFLEKYYGPIQKQPPSSVPDGLLPRENGAQQPVA